MGIREYNEATGELKFFDEAGNIVYHRPSRQGPCLWLDRLVAVSLCCCVYIIVDWVLS